MAATYPGGIASLTTKNDGDTIFASHVDALQDEVIAIETALINGFQHNISPLNDNSKDLGDATHAWKNLWTKGTAQFNGVPYTFPAADGAANTYLRTNGSKVLAWVNPTGLTYTWPGADGGASTVLQTNGAGTLSWVAPSTSAWTVITTTSTGTQNNFAPGLSGHTILRCNNATLLTITGFSGGTDGQHLIIESIQEQVDLPHQNASSTAGNRLLNVATSGNTSLAASTGVCEYVYDATTARWRLVSHDQGAWITPAFAAGNYTGNASMTWTLTSGDVTTQAYWLKGRTLTVSWYLQTTTVGGTANIALQIGNGAWGGFTATKSMGNAMQYTDNSATVWAHGHAYIAAATTVIQLYRVTFGTNNWTLSTDLNYQMGQLSFEVN